jgi:hypothetical protein
VAEFTSKLTVKHQAFIAKQHMFFVATAPSEGGRINLSPKGLDTFRVIDESRVAYLDLTGSGNETAAHLEDNGRITLMLCAFAGAPSILRIYGKGRIVQPVDTDWEQWSAHFPALVGARQVMVIDIDSVQTSCGYAVPEYEHKKDRPILTNWAEKQGSEGLEAYRTENNQTSIDGAPTGYRPK